jgi:NADH:ubiquinone oxidoreductase subunit 6 (subunit J)
MPRLRTAWTGAVIVTVITAVLVVLDLTDRSVHRYWSRHAFTASVLSGVLVLLVTVLIVDRVSRGRQVRNQGRAVAAQAAIIVGQATRTVDALKHAS